MGRTPVPFLVSSSEEPNTNLGSEQHSSQSTLLHTERSIGISCETKRRHVRESWLAASQHSNSALPILLQKMGLAFGKAMLSMKEESRAGQQLSVRITNIP
jgi:hypothetical protein